MMLEGQKTILTIEEIEALLKEAVSLSKAYEGKHMGYVFIAPLQVRLETLVQQDKWKQTLIGVLFLDCAYHSMGHDLSRSAKLLHHIIYEL